jgi:Glyoxalase-like domain
VADIEAEVRRLEALGARIDVGQGDDVAWVPMADSEGNEFCVCPGAPLNV